MRFAVAALFVLLAWQGSAATSPGASGDVLLRGRAVYEGNCAVCHGVGGDGNGMAAHMFRVQPRDLRRGLFKFRSTPSGSLPTDGDLRRTITEGIRWTGMVGRPDLSEADRRAVAQYVKTFSPRFTDAQASSPVAVPPAPPKSPDLVAQGEQLYRDAECGKCHGERGHGDGASAPGMRDDWGWPTRPTDLTWRPLKRGSTPDGMYLTVATGLSGTPMPSYGDSLESREISALVYYLESLVPADHRLSPLRPLGEERAGWMVIRMHGMMMGPGRMGPGMMRRMPMMR